MGNMSINQFYHGFKVEGHSEDPTFGDYYRCIFRVKKEGKLVFRHSVQISGDQSVMSYPQQSKAEINEALLQRGFNRVCGKIDLQAYQESEDTEYRIPEDDLVSKKPLTSKEIRLKILNVLFRIKRIEVERAMITAFNVDGFCEILGIEKADYRVNADLLCDMGYAKDSIIEQLTREMGGIYITAAGILYLEEGTSLKPAINITNIDTGGGPFINRDVNTGGGDFTGRDKNLEGNPIPEKPMSKDALSDEEKEILKAGYRGELWIFHPPNSIPHIKSKNPDVQPFLKDIKYYHALKRLVEKGLIEKISDKPKTYFLTEQGYIIAESLIKAL